MAKKVSIELNLKSNVHDKTNEAKKDLKALRSSISGASNGITDAFAKSSIIGWGVALKQAMQIMVKASSAQTAYIENLNLLQNAYNGVSESGEKLIQTMSEQIGYDPASLTKNLAMYRQFGNALNIDSKYANLLAENLLKMQTDISSLYNLDETTVANKLTSALAGQTRAVRTLGADITQATLQQEAYKYGIKTSVSEMNRASKTVLIYLTLQDQLANSNGDVSRTVNSLANQTRIMKDQFAIAGRQIGAIFIPILQAIVPVINGIMMAFNEIGSMMLSFFGIDAKTLSSQFGTATTNVDDLSDSLNNAGNSAKKADQSLRDFDKLHVITTPKKSGSGTGGIGYVDPKLLKALGEYNLQLDKMRNKATEIKEIILNWLKIFETLYEPISKIAGITYDGLKYIWENVLVPLGKWTFWTLIPQIISTTSSGLNLIYEIMKDLSPMLDATYKNVIQPFARSIGNAIIDILKAIKKLFDAIANDKFLVWALSLVGYFKLLQISGEALVGIFGKTKLGGAVFALGDIFKEAYKETGNFKKALSLTADVALTTQKNMSKMQKAIVDSKNAVKGFIEFATGLEMVKGSFEDIAENGLNIGNSLEGLIGILATVAGSITLVTTALDVLKISIDPIYLVITAIGGLVTALGFGADAFSKHKQAVEDNRTELEKTIDTANKSADADLAQIGRSQELEGELGNLVDSNGKVQNANKERVNYILGTLNNALGTEYKLVGDHIEQNGQVVTSYDDIKNSIDGVIEEKKKEIILRQYEGAYIQALQDRQNKINELREAFKEYNDDHSIGAEEYKKKIDEINNKYDKSEKTVTDYENLIGATGKDVMKEVDNFSSDVGLSTDDTYNDVVKKAQSAYDSINACFSDGTTAGSNFATSYYKGFSKSLSGKSFDLSSDNSDIKKTGFRFGGFKANGGFLKSAEIYGVRENGIPEMVGQIGNRPAVANNDQIVDGIAVGVAKAMMSVGNRQTNVNIIAKGDTQGLMNFITFKQMQNDRKYGM